MPSAPEEKTQGWVGWKSTSRTPRSNVVTWPFSTLTGTSSGFCSRSLWQRRRVSVGLQPLTPDIPRVTPPRRHRQPPRALLRPLATYL